MKIQMPGAQQGQIEIKATQVGYLDQRYGSLNSDESLLQNLQARTRFSETELRNELAFYGFTGESVFQQINTLSGGELMRACLAQIFLGEAIPELILLDEPTNNLDLQSLELLEAALRNFRGALLIVSHDEAFIKNLKVTDRFDLSPPP
jgi:ATPase subunit of ABC transporter with duplicated ATPase domains